MTQKFIKKSIEVEAVQLTDKNKDQVYTWASSIQNNVYHTWDENKQPALEIPTLEGEMICALGDYIIVEPFPTDWRKLYPCKQSVFEKTYSKKDDNIKHKKSIIDYVFYCTMVGLMITVSYFITTDIISSYAEDDIFTRKLNALELESANAKLWFTYMEHKYTLIWLEYGHSDNYEHLDIYTQ